MNMEEIRVDGQRVNVIKSTFDNDADGVVLTMYLTNKRLGSVTNSDIGVGSFTDSGAKNKTHYMQYCKEVLINLLENGGVQGYYYDRGQVGKSSNKYDVSGFTKKAEDILVSTVMGVLDGITGPTLRVVSSDINVTDRYRDGYIKSAVAHLKVDIGGSIPNQCAVAVVEIKSGQLCKPRRLGDTPITRTGIGKLFAVI